MLFFLFYKIQEKFFIKKKFELNGIYNIIQVYN